MLTAFSAPKVYEIYKVPIDQFVKKSLDSVNEIVSKLVALSVLLKFKLMNAKFYSIPVLGLKRRYQFWTKRKMNKKNRSNSS